jgi:hypothetical protein
MMLSSFFVLLESNFVRIKEDGSGRRYKRIIEKLENVN